MSQKIKIFFLHVTLPLTNSRLLLRRESSHALSGWQEYTGTNTDANYHIDGAVKLVHSGLAHGRELR